MSDTLPPRIRSRERLQYIVTNAVANGYELVVQLDGGGARVFFPQGATLAHITGRLGELAIVLEETANARHDRNEQ